MKTNKLLLLALILVLALAACGGGDDDGDFNLSQSISLEDPEVGIKTTVKYPDGWVASSDDGQIQFANSQEAFDAVDNDAPEGGMVIGTVAGFPVEMAAMFGAAEGAGPEDIIGTFAQIFSSEGGEFGDPETFEIDGKSAARITGNTTVEGETLNVVLVVVDEGDGFGIVIIMTVDDIDQYKTLAKDIAGTLEIE